MKRILSTFTGRRVGTLLLLGAFLQVQGCGVLLYPERQGQKGGRIDMTVALLDGIGLFFFIIPGLVALAVDFHQGTIYLPGGRASVEGETDYTLVKVEGEVTEESIEQALEAHLGRKVDLSAESVQIHAIEPHQLPMVNGVLAWNNSAPARG
jgi:hypothetical protein